MAVKMAEHREAIACMTGWKLDFGPDRAEDVRMFTRLSNASPREMFDRRPEPTEREAIAAAIPSIHGCLRPGTPVLVTIRAASAAAGGRASAVRLSSPARMLDAISGTTRGCWMPPTAPTASAAKNVGAVLAMTENRRCRVDKRRELRRIGPGFLDDDVGICAVDGVRRQVYAGDGRVAVEDDGIGDASATAR